MALSAIRIRLTVALFSLLFTQVRSVHQHEDLIVAIGDRLEFLTNGTNHQKINLESFNASKISALAYDNTARKLFFSDRSHDYGHIFRIELEQGSHSKVEEIVKRSKDSTVENVAFDPVEQTLMWTDSLNRSINRLEMKNNCSLSNGTKITRLIQFSEKDDKPRGLVCDSCTRALYWTNRNMRNPTIERSNLDGSNRQVIVQTNLLPQALDLDVLEQRLYWADNLRNGYFLIERSYVNGKGRQLMYRGIGQFVVSLVVGRFYVYWSDYDQKKIWFIRKDGSMDEPQMLRQYYEEPPMALVRFSTESLNCSLVVKQDLISENNQKDYNQTEQLFAVAVSVNDSLSSCQSFCFNNGQCKIASSSLICSCQPGFSGDQCEIASAEELARKLTRYASTELDGGNWIFIYVAISIICLLLVVFAILFRLLTGEFTACQRLLCPSRPKIRAQLIPIEQQLMTHSLIVLNVNSRQSITDERPWTLDDDGLRKEIDTENLIHSDT